MLKTVLFPNHLYLSSIHTSCSQAYLKKALAQLGAAAASCLLLVRSGKQSKVKEFIKYLVKYLLAP